MEMFMHNILYIQRSCKVEKEGKNAEICVIPQYLSHTITPVLNFLHLLHLTCSAWIFFPVCCQLPSRCYCYYYNAVCLYELSATNSVRERKHGKYIWGDTAERLERKVVAVSRAACCCSQGSFHSSVTACLDVWTCIYNTTIIVSRFLADFLLCCFFLQLYNIAVIGFGLGSLVEVFFK